MKFDFRQELIEEGEIDEEAAYRYAEELSQMFAESPEGEALAEHGVEPGHYLVLFLDYALRYVGVNPAEMDASDIREALEVLAVKVTARPEDFDRAIPELEAFSDFVGRAFAFQKAAEWKRAIRDYAPEFRRAIRDPRRWGMAKSMMMEGISRGYDLTTEEGINQWIRTKQTGHIAAIEARKGWAPTRKMSFLDRLRRAIGLPTAESVPGVGEQGNMEIVIGDFGDGEPNLLAPGSSAFSKPQWKKAKGRRKQAKASRRRNR